MNYSSLNTRELLHYAGLDAKSDLELALVTALGTAYDDKLDFEEECNFLKAKLEAAPDADTIQGYIENIREELNAMERFL